MVVNKIFFDRWDRLRSGWRLAMFLLLFVLLSTGGALLASGLMTAFAVSPHTGSPSVFALNSFILLCSALGAGWLAGRLLEGLPFQALGATPTARGIRNFVIGCAVGAVTVSLAVFIGFSFGGLRFQVDAAASVGSIFTSALIAFGIFAVAAAFEEALFRGFILQTFARSGLAWLAILLTSSFFGVAHLSNPNAGAISTVNTMIAGIWFGIAYLKTRDLWFVTGIHLMWNWMQGSVFGIEVSGLKELSKTPMMREVDYGPAWLTGGDYGVEGGIACTIAIVVSSILIRNWPQLVPTEEMRAFSEPPILKDRPHDAAI